MSATVDTLPGDEDLDLIEAALDRMTTIDDWQLCDEMLLQQMDRLGVIDARIHGLRLTRIRAVDDRGSCVEVGPYATSDRITLTDRTDPRTARHQVRTSWSRCTSPMPKTTGSLTTSNARTTAPTNSDR